MSNQKNLKRLWPPGDTVTPAVECVGGTCALALGCGSKNHKDWVFLSGLHHHDNVRSMIPGRFQHLGSDLQIIRLRCSSVCISSTTV